MVDLVVLAALVDSVASFLQTWSGRAIAFVVGLGILGIIFRKFVTRVFDSVMGELVRLSDGIPYLHPFLKWLHPKPIEEVADSQEETKEVVDEIHEEVVTTPVERLENQGLKRLTEEDFDPGKRDPEACWRRPFEFAEIRADFAIHRQRTDDERTDVTEDLLAKLGGEEGQSQIVVGPPGSGKTTVCKTVATEWYESEETGPVFYRESGATHSITDPGDVVEGLSKLSENGAEGRVLVVVEDAVRAGTIQIHKAIDDCPDKLDVSFLLDAREHEWDDFGEFVRTHLEMGTAWNRILDNRKGNVARYQMPTLDPEEVRRVVEKFAEVTDSSEDRLPSPENLHQKIRGDVDLEGGRSAGPSPMLLLTYHFPVGGIDISGQDEDKSALRIHVEEVYSEVSNGADDSAAGSGLLDDVALLVNVLNAADIGVHEELVQTVANDDDERAQVGEHLRGDLAGLLTYGEREGKQFWSNHELWSQVYLDHYIGVVGDDHARNRLGEVVSEFLSIADGEDTNPELWRWYQGDTELLREIEERPTEKADEFVSGVFDIGVQRPGLVTLLGRTNDHDPIDVPAACSRVVRANRPIWRGHAYQGHGDYGKAESEYEMAIQVADDLGVDEERSRAPILNNLGVVAEAQSEYDDAREYYEESLAITRNLGDRATEANTLGNLGTIARDQEDFETAKGYYEDAAEIFRDIGAIRELLQTHGNLARVCEQQNDLESAIEWCETGLSTIEQADIAGLEDEREAFETLLDRFQAPERPIEDLYADALENVLDNEGGTALQFFRHAWDKRDEASDDQHPTALAAGVGVAGHAELFDDEESVEEKREILEEIEPKRDQLPDPVGAVFEYLADGEVDTTPTKLLEATAPELANADEISPEDLDRDELEALAFARLLELLTPNFESPEEIAVAGYEQALRHIVESEAEDAVQLLHGIWDGRDDIEEAADAFSQVLAAGVGLLAHIELFDVEDAEQEGNEIIESIAPERDRLPDPARAVFEHLADGETEATPDDLLEPSGYDRDDLDDLDPGNLDHGELEAVAFARLLEALTTGPDSPEETVVAGYARALQHLADEDVDEAMQSLYTVWDSRDDVEEEEQAFSAALAAGVGFAVLTTFFDDEQADEDRREVLDEIAQHEDRLGQPELALYEYLSEGETDTTPEELRDEVDEEGEDLDVYDIEYIAYAGLLEALQEQDEEQ